MLAESPRVDQREQGTGNRNGGCRVDYEIVHVVPAAPFLNECHCGASIALKDWLRVALKDLLRVVATVFSGIPRLILSRELMLWLGCIAPCAAFPVPCSLLTVPFALPFAFLPTAR